MQRQSAKSALPATTPYDTNAAARAVYLKFFGDAYRIAAAGRTNITYAYHGAYVRAAMDGQWEGVEAGVQSVRGRGLQRLQRGPPPPATTPYDREPDARAAYLRSCRENYLRALSGQHTISCFPQSRVGEAYCRGEREGQNKAMEDMLAVERSCLTQHSHLSECMAKQQPQIRCESSTSSIRDAVGMFRAFLRLF